MGAPTKMLVNMSIVNISHVLHPRNLKRAEKRDGRCDVLASGHGIYETKMTGFMKLRSNHANIPMWVGDNARVPLLPQKQM